MLFRQFKSEKGITFVELLAAISLFAVLIGLSSTLIVQLLNSQEATSSQISLQQDANVIITDLRQQYNDDDINKLCIEDNRFTLSEITNGDKDGNCVNNINDTRPLSFTLTSERHSQDFSLQTTWDKKEDFAMNVQESWPVIVDTNDISCTYTENTLFRAADTNKIMFKQNLCDGNYVVEGDARLEGQIQLQNKVQLTIKNNLYFDHEKFLKASNSKKNSGKLCVEGEIDFPDNLVKDDFDHIFTCD